MSGQDPLVNKPAKYQHQIFCKMLFIDLCVCVCTNTHTHTHNQALLSRGTLLFTAHNCLCLCVWRLVQKALDNEVCHQGMWIPLLLSLSLPPLFPVQVPLHIWITPTADNEQGSGWREEGRFGWGGAVSQSSLGRLPPVQEERAAQCYCKCLVYERKHKYCPDRMHSLIYRQRYI